MQVTYRVISHLSKVHVAVLEREMKPRGNRKRTLTSTMKIESDTAERLGNVKRESGVVTDV